MSTVALTRGAGGAGSGRNSPRLARQWATADFQLQVLHEFHPRQLSSSGVRVATSRSLPPRFAVLPLFSMSLLAVMARCHPSGLSILCCVLPTVISPASRRVLQCSRWRLSIGGQNRADFFKSLRESAKSAVRALFADFFDVLQTFCRLF